MQNESLLSHAIEPMVLNEKEVCELLPLLDAKQTMKSLFKALAEDKAIQPPQTLTLFPEDKGDYITYLGALTQEGAFGAKLSPYLVMDSGPLITAWTNLMSMQTGQPLLWCDSGKLTIERTAATTAVAIEYLAPQTITHLALIGTGSVGIAHLKHVIGLRKWETISIFSPALNDNSVLKEMLFNMDSRIQVSNSVADCVGEADVIMLCTSSANAVISFDDIKPSAVVTSISTNAANAHEVPPELLNKSDVYCDYKKTTPDTAGEMCIATAEHGWNKSRIMGDLTDLVTENCALPKYDKPVFFRSIGLGLEDVAMAYGIWKLATQK